METTIALLRLAIATLTDRLLTILSLLMTFALACWVMYQPTWEREGMAGFFALAVFLPCAIRERPKKEKVNAQAASVRPQTEYAEG